MCKSKESIYPRSNMQHIHVSILIMCHWWHAEVMCIPTAAHQTYVRACVRVCVCVYIYIYIYVKTQNKDLGIGIATSLFKFLFIWGCWINIEIYILNKPQKRSDIKKGHQSIDQSFTLPAILMTDCVLNLNGWNMYNSSEMLRSVIVDVFTIGWSMPSMSTQFPAGTRLTSTLYLKHIPLTHQLEFTEYYFVSYLTDS